MPDYLGLGQGRGIHPYHHAKSEAIACIDMLRWVRDYCYNHDSKWNGQLFLLGYSQGGHATMAMHREIETYYPDEFIVSASAPLSEAYDISGVQASVLESDMVYPSPGYLPFLLFAYLEVYGNLYDSIQQLLIEPYATTIPPFLDMTHGMGEIDDAMTDVSRDTIQPDIFSSYMADTNHLLRHALRDNDVYHWTPNARYVWHNVREICM